MNSRTTEQWTEYLAERAAGENVDLWLKPAELYGWCSSRVGPDDAPDVVWAALQETLAAAGAGTRRLPAKTARP